MGHSDLTDLQRHRFREGQTDHSGRMVHVIQDAKSVVRAEANLPGGPKRAGSRRGGDSPFISFL